MNAPGDVKVTGSVALDGFDERAALFSDCRRFRYRLRRAWRPAARPLGWLMLNPSTADGENDDQTLASITRKAQRYGFGALEVANLYGLVATDPMYLVALGHSGRDVVGKASDDELREFLRLCPDIVLGWGNGPYRLQTADWHRRRMHEVLRSIASSGNRIYAIELTAAGMPRHPLYMRDDSIPFRVARDGEGPPKLRAASGYNIFRVPEEERRERV